MSHRRAGRRFGPAGLTAALLAAALALPAAAQADSPGPALTVPSATLAAALTCPSAFASQRDPVLLVHGTGATTATWQAAMQPALTAAGYDTCTVQLPDDAWADAQISSQYVVSSVRTIATRAGRPVAVVGYSQGGILPRWAIRFWPDIRTLMAGYIGMEATNHGAAADLGALCTVACAPALWDQLPTSQFLTTLNSGFETVPYLNYTSISSATDTTAPPPTENLQGGSNVVNISLQSICPGRQVSHSDAPFDAAEYAIVLDALGHHELADASRISPSICAQKYVPGSNPSADSAQENANNQIFLTSYTAAGLPTSAPAPAPYASQPPPTPAGSLRASVTSLRAGRRVTVTFSATGSYGGSTWPLPGALITVDHRQLQTNASGTATTTLSFRRAGIQSATLTASGLAPIHLALHVHAKRPTKRRL